MKKPKVLFLVQLPPPVHGASVINQTIFTSEVIKTKFETCFVDITTAERISDLGRISLFKIAKTFLNLFKCLWAFFKFKPDLVYITLSPHGYAFIKDAIISQSIKLLGGRVVFHLHGKGINHEISESSFKKFIYKIVFRNVDIIHLSKSLFYDVELIRDKSKRILSVPNGIKDCIIPKTETSEKIKFLFLSNIVRDKGAHLLIKAANMIPFEYREKYEVEIVGNGSDIEYMNEIEQLIKENESGNVKYVGPKYGDEKIETLRNSDVFVLPTKYKNECFPLSILEAMSAGLMVIATPEGAIPEIVTHNESGILLSSNTVKELSDIMMGIIDSPIVASEMGRMGRKKYEDQYSVVTFEENLLMTINELIKC